MRRFAFALVLIATPAAAQEAPFLPDVAERAVRGVLAAPPLPGLTLSADNVSLDGSTLRLDGLQATLTVAWFGTTSRVTVTAPVALIDKLTRAGDRWQATAIRVPSAAMVSDGAEQPVGRIELDAPSWPAAVAAAPATDGPAAALEPAFRLLAGATVEGVEAAIPAGTLTLGPIEAGRISSVSLAAPVSETGSPQELTVEGLDLAAVAAALFDDGGPARVGLAKVTITGFESPDPDGGVSGFAGASLEEVYVTPQSPPLAARIDDYAAAAAAPPIDPEAPHPEAIDLGLAAVRAVAVGRADFDGFFQRRSDGNESRIDRTSVVGGPGRPFDYISEGMSFTTPDGEQVRIARVGFSGITLPEAAAVRAMMLAGRETPPTDVIVGVLPIVRRAAIEGLETETANGTRVAIEEASIAMGGHIGTIPTRLETSARGSVDLGAVADPATQGFVEALTKTGRTQIEFTGGDRYEWADGRLSYGSTVDVGGLGRYAMRLAFSGIPRYIFETPARAAEVVAFLSLDELSLALTDDGGMALARSIVEADGRDLDAEVATALAELEVQAATAIGPEDARRVREALTAFAAGGRTITLAGQPERPVPITQLGVAAIAPRALVGLLKLTLTVTP